MTGFREANRYKEAANRRIDLCRIRSVVTALVLAVGVSVLSANGNAAEPSGPRHGRELGALLAAASESVLSESDMAGQKGAGLRPPNMIANETNGAPKVMLWDEMKTSPMLNPAQDGVVIGGVGGK